jgi:hypothetical protein
MFVRTTWAAAVSGVLLVSATALALGSWQLKSRTQLGNGAELLRFEGKCMNPGDPLDANSNAVPAPLCGAAGTGVRLQLVVGGRVVANEEAGNIEIEKTAAGGLTWDVRGDGIQSILISKADNGAQGGLQWVRYGESVFAERATDRWIAGNHDVPEHHQGIVALADGRPGFVGDLHCVQLVTLPTAVEDHVCVGGLRAWDGKTFADDLVEFRLIYQRWLNEAGSKAAGLARNPKACPHEELRTALALYCYRRILGESEADARASSDAVMRGLDPKLCRDPAALAEYPTPGWPEILSDLRAASLPRLGRTATAAATGRPTVGEGAPVSSIPVSLGASRLPTCEAQTQADTTARNAAKATREADCHKVRAAQDAELEVQRKVRSAQHVSPSATESHDRRLAAKQQADCLQDATDKAVNEALRSEVSKAACLTRERSPRVADFDGECRSSCRKASEGVLARYCDAMTRSRQYRRSLAMAEDNINCREEYGRCLVRAARLSEGQRSAVCGGGLNQCISIRAKENQAFDRQIAQKNTACLANDRALFEIPCLQECGAEPPPEMLAAAAVASEQARAAARESAAQMCEQRMKDLADQRYKAFAAECALRFSDQRDPRFRICLLQANEDSVVYQPCE